MQSTRLSLNFELYKNFFDELTHRPKIFLLLLLLCLARTQEKKEQSPMTHKTLHLRFMLSFVSHKFFVLKGAKKKFPLGEVTLDAVLLELSLSSA